MFQGEKEKGERYSYLHDLLGCVHESPNYELQGRDHGNELQVGARRNLHDSFEICDSPPDQSERRRQNQVRILWISST